MGARKSHNRTHYCFFFEEKTYPLGSEMGQESLITGPTIVVFFKRRLIPLAVKWGQESLMIVDVMICDKHC